MNTALIISSMISLAAVIATFWGIQYTNKVNRTMQDDRLRFDERRQHREMLRLKGEEAFELIGSFESNLRHCLSDFSSALITQGAYTYGKPFSGINFVESTKMRRRVELLVKTYFPSAIPQLTALLVYEGGLSKYLTDLSLKPTSSVQQTADSLILISTYVDEHSQKLQQAIVAALQKLHEDVNL